MNAPTTPRAVLEIEDEALAHDPEQLRAALDHILRAARSSQSQTKRIRWIGQRAEEALIGKPYDPRNFERPKFGNLTDKLHQRLVRTRAVLAKLLAVSLATNDPDESKRPTEEAWEAAEAEAQLLLQETI